MSYVSLLKNLPDFLSQPAGIAAIASLGIHGALGFLLPLMPVDDNKGEAASQRQVGLMNLNAAEQARLPQVNPQAQSPQLGISSQVTLPNFATKPSELPPLGTLPPLGSTLPPLGSLPIDKYPRVTSLPNATQNNNQITDPRMAMGGIPTQQYPQYYQGSVTQPQYPVGSTRQQVYSPTYIPQSPVQNTPQNPPQNSDSGVPVPPPPPPSASLNFGPPLEVSGTKEPTTDAMRKMASVDYSSIMNQQNWRSGSPNDVVGDTNNSQGTEQPDPNQVGNANGGKTSGQLLAALRDSQQPGATPSTPTTNADGGKTSGQLLAALRNSQQPEVPPSTTPNNQSEQPYKPSAGAVQAISSIDALEKLREQNPGMKPSGVIRRTIDNQAGVEGNASGYVVVKDGRIAQVDLQTKPSAGNVEQAVKNALTEEIKGSGDRIIPINLVFKNGSSKPAEANQQKPAASTQPASQTQSNNQTNNNRQQPTTSNNPSPQAKPTTNSPASRLRSNNPQEKPTQETKQPPQTQSKPVREPRPSNQGNSLGSRPRSNNTQQKPTQETKPPSQNQSESTRGIRSSNQGNSPASRLRSNNTQEKPTQDSKKPESWNQRLRPSSPDNQEQTKQ
ncbi:MAG: hypothetical protein VKL59_22815 [Nostocaceae cyanobacterium]|nr:hypothetical protein [Nostocaceae cyanobacterium]